ncbi:helix-turn-helix transcriptional regulator [Sphaerisporangium sp. NPDC051011]|uniref:helix-turn-helix domain-containing protein n=1 Tax=Sphaerisporangium sp. NPDC051011 TaxID=3155792 RepID=UPI00340E3F82
MKGRRTSPTLRRRRLASELRRLREVSDLTRDEAARRMGWHGSKISRIETGESSVHPGDVRDLVDMYDVVEPEQRDALVTLAREAKQRGWWMRYNDVFTSPFVGLEAEAATIRTYQPQLVPGLLQTGDYATAVTRMALAGGDRSSHEVERRVAARLDRQKLLTAEDPPAFWAILDEAALRRTVGSKPLMREQMDHLIKAVNDEQATLQVLPFTAGVHPAMAGQFVILDFIEPSDAPVVYLETDTEELYLETPEQIAHYNVIFDYLRAMALGPDESVQLIARMTEDLG